MTRALVCLLLAAASAYPNDLSAGKILVASRKSKDPDLAQAVILLVRYDRQAAIGLFLNRPQNMRVSEVYPEFKGARQKLYAGGPVTTGIRALYRSRTSPAGATHILGDVSMISTKPLLAQMVDALTRPDMFRIYAGYTGWSTGQLKDEIAGGLWHVVTGDPNMIFDPHPETLWRRLIDRVERR